MQNPIPTVLRNPLLTFALLAVIALASLQPLFYGMAQGKMLMTDDGNLHLYRVIALDYGLTYDDSLYPRYISALALGYGAPLFNFFSPFAYFLPRTLHTFGFDFLSAWYVAMMAYVLAGMWGIYRLTAHWATHTGALIAATSFAYAPYILFDTITRGTLTEVAALACLPHVMAQFSALSKYPSLRRWVWATATFTLFIPIHNIVTVHGTLLLGGYALFLVWHAPRAHRRNTFLALLMSGIMGILLSAFFWVPALLETAQVQINAVTQGINSLDVTQHLRPLSEVLAPPTTTDTSQLNFAMPITLSLASLAIAVLGLGLGIWQKRLLGVLGFMGLATLMSLFMNLPPSAPIWQTVPLLNYTQYAWRVLGVGSITLAVLAGVGGGLMLQAIPTQRLSAMVFTGFMLAIILYSLPWLYRPYANLEATTILDAQAYEYERGELALSSFSEYLPIWHEGGLDFATMQARWQAGYPIQRVNDTLTTVNVSSIAWHGTSAQMHISAPQAGVLVLDWLYMPNWQATLNGQPIPITASESMGLLKLEIPAGEHLLDIRLVASPLQTLGTGISFMALLTLLGVLAFSFRRAPATRTEPANNAPLAPVLGWLVVALGLLVFGLKSSVLDHQDTPFHTQSLQHLDRIVSHPLHANWHNEIVLVGIDNLRVAPQQVTFASYWQPLIDVESDYTSLYTLKDKAGNIIAQSEYFYPAGLATRHWQAGYYLREEVTLAIPAHTLPIDYTLSIALYNSDTLALLPIYNAAGNPEGVDVTLDDTIPIPSHTPHAQASLESLAIASVLIESDLADVLTVGDSITMYGLWQVANVGDALSVGLVWEQNGETIAQTALQPLSTSYPTTNWQMGDVWRVFNTFIVRDLPERGNYTLRLAISNGEGTASLLLNEQVRVNVPERITTPPIVASPLAQAWENGITLQGYAWDATSNALTLYWQTGKTLDESLRLFVHVVDGERIVTVRDEVPVGWTRPTTGWATDEFIITRYTWNDLEAGTYGIRIGWYNPLTNQRIPLNTGVDALTLPMTLAIPASP